MATTAAPAEKSSVWEDFVDIFYAPASVFSRRRDGKFGLALLVYVVLTAGIFAAIRPLMEPIFSSMTTQAIEKARRDNPSISEDQLRAGMAIQEKLTTGPIGIVFGAIMAAVTVFVVGILLWLVAKMFGSTASAGQAAMVATYAFFPRLLGSIVGAVILYLSPPERLTSMANLTVSPAQFVDGTAQPVLAAVLARFDLFVLWATVLLGIGIAIVGKIPRGKGLAAAFVVWLLATLTTVMQAFSQAG